MIVLTVVRHGQTQWNAQKRWQGVLDSPLTEKGIQEMIATAKLLKFKNFDEIHVSPLGRALQSLDVILEQNPHFSPLPRLTFDSLKERNVGHLQGIPTDEIIKNFPEEIKVRLETPLDWKPKDGESSAQFIQRVKSYVDELLENNSGKVKRILVVAHGGICAQLHTRLLDHPPIKAWDWKIPNGAISTYLSTSQGWSCIETQISLADETMDWIAT